MMRSGGFSLGHVEIKMTRDTQVVQVSKHNRWLEKCSGVGSLEL